MEKGKIKETKSGERKQEGRKERNKKWKERRLDLE